MVDEVWEGEKSSLSLPDSMIDDWSRQIENKKETANRQGLHNAKSYQIKKAGKKYV